MNSTRAAYKAKLRETSSIANRRRSRGEERKNNRDDELRKRRNFSNDMSPVAEKHENYSVSLKRTKKGPGREKADDVLERLKQWREEKKRQREQEKLGTRAKPVFKAGPVVRGSEAELFKRGSNTGKDESSKAVEKKAPPPKKQPAKTKEPALPSTRASKSQRGADVGIKSIATATAKVPPPKKQPVRAKDPAPAPTTTRAQRQQRTADLASKLTAAAAAKRNVQASPKKFLRATRANTLQKKEQVDDKKSTKSLKGLKSTGNLLTKNMDLGTKSLKASSKSTGNLLPKQMDKEKTEDDFTSVDSSDNMVVANPVKNFTSIIPNEVPEILTDFDFSAMTSSTNSASDSKAESSDNLDDVTFAGLKLKSKRKSTRKSTRLTSLNGDTTDSSNGFVENFDDNLITFTPGLSGRKSVRKSKGMHSPLVQPSESMEVDDVPKLIESDIPKSVKRQSMPKSARLDALLKESLPATPKSGRRRSVRKSIRLAAEDIAETFARATPKSSKRKSMRKSTRLATQSEENVDDLVASSPKVDMSLSATTKSGRRRSIRKSRVLGSAASKQFDDMHISDQGDSPNNLHSPRNGNTVELTKPVLAGVDSGIPTTPTSSSSRKSFRKSFSLEAALALVQSESDHVLNSGSELSHEEEMDVDTAPPATSDADTQVPLGEATSTPKVMGASSAQLKRRSLMKSMAVSSIEDISFEELPAPSPKPSRRSSRGTRRSSVLRRRSRRSVATPGASRRSASGVDLELNVSNVSTPNSVRNIENIPRRRSTVISVSDEGTAVGRELEPALAYKLEKACPSARASRILNELVIEKVDGEKSFFEVSFDESIKGGASRNNSMNLSSSKCNSPFGVSKTPQSNTTSPFTPRKSNEVTASNSSASSSPLTTPKSAKRTRHSVAPSSGFKEPGLPLSALRQAGSVRRKTYCTPKSKTPEQMISILKKSPMVEMSRRRSRHMTSPAAPKGQYFRDLVTSETERLSILSNKWNDIAAGEVGLQEEVLGQIRSTVGKAQLLMDQRFKQFSGLVDNYVYDLGEKKTTPTDLQGFWDMIYFQVEDVNNQFKDLDELQQSGWQVKSNSPKASSLNLKKKVITKGRPKVKGVKSNFAAFRAELQKKKAAQATSSLPTDDMFVA